jgi:hypothetical protein
VLKKKNHWPQKVRTDPGNSRNENDMKLHKEKKMDMVGTCFKDG